MKNFVALFILLFLISCTSSKDIDRIYIKLNDLESQILEIKRNSIKQKDIQDLSKPIEKEVQKISKTNADIATKMNEFSLQVESLKERLKDTNDRLSNLSQQISQTQKELQSLKVQPAQGSTPQPLPTQATDVDVFEESLNDFMKGRYTLSISGFEQYLKDFPSTEKSDDAIFYIAESHYQLKNYKKAIENYEELLKRFPKSEKAPESRLKKGLSLLEIGEKTKGIVELQYCVYEYPSTEEANRAKEKLKALGIAVN